MSGSILSNREDSKVSPSPSAAVKPKRATGSVAPQA
jgi:hypothetical protein